MSLTKKVAIKDEALAVIGRMTWEENGQVVGRLPAGQLERKLYEEVNKGLEALGGKWNRGKGGHVFQIDPRQQINDLLGNGYVTVEKDGFFETPRTVTLKMIEMLRYPVREPILEPSAGLGAIADALLEAGYPNIVVIEKNEARRQKLMDKYYTVWAGIDFLSHYNTFPTIIMNPPFEAGQDIDHITHAFKHCLEPGGELVSVCSSGPFFRSDRKSEAFRDLVKAYGYSQELPEGSFKGSGTMVNTRLVYLRKPLD